MKYIVSEHIDFGQLPGCEYFPGIEIYLSAFDEKEEAEREAEKVRQTTSNRITLHLQQPIRKNQ